MAAIRFEPFELPPEAESLRAEVREFLRVELAGHTPRQRAESWSHGDAGFSRKLGARGWIGMTWPRRYGGHERSALERYVVLEELLASGAPVSFHWVADRQSGPLLLRFGTEAQRRRILPGIARGELCFCIGMSEPDAGSDLASLRSRAARADGGWRLNGRKVWTSKANIADYMIGLFRTAPADPKNRHAGLSQLLIDMQTPGITVSPIKSLAGEHPFNEVLFEEVLVPEEALLGEEGGGWGQVTAELALERSGPERYLSSYQLLVELIREVAAEPSERAAVEVGRLVARLATLRRMSLSVAGMLQAGASPLLESAVVKVLGVAFEQDIPRVAHDLAGGAAGGSGEGDFRAVLDYVAQVAPSFSLRGGTPEILRGIIARGLDLR